MYSWKGLAYLCTGSTPKAKEKMLHLTKQVNSEASSSPGCVGEKGQGVESVKEVRCAHVPHNGGMWVGHHFSVLGLPKETAPW